MVIILYRTTTFTWNKFTHTDPRSLVLTWKFDIGQNLNKIANPNKILNLRAINSTILDRSMVFAGGLCFFYLLRWGIVCYFCYFQASRVVELRRELYNENVEVVQQEDSEFEDSEMEDWNNGKKLWYWLYCFLVLCCYTCPSHKTHQSQCPRTDLQVK